MCGGLACFSLEASPERFESLSRCLDPMERSRAARFIAAEHRERFTVAHGCLRELLGQVLGLPPEALTFATGEHGKPVLAGRAAEAGLRFNLSHSGTSGLVGWAWQRDIGVDIESWRAMHDEAALVRRYFSPVERASYEARAPGQRTEAFFNGWTRKEAYVKAVGRGLGLPLDSFDVTLESGAGARLLRSSGEWDQGRTWSLAAPPHATGISLAVVLQAEACHVLPVA